MSNALDRRRADLLERAETWAGMSEPDRRQAATIAAHERDAAALWSLTEAFITLHGGKGTKVSPRTLDAYRRGVDALISDWQGENLIRPSRDAGVVHMRRLEAKYAPATLAVHRAACRAFYRALVWAGATTADPFADVKVGADETPPDKKRDAYSETHVERMKRAAGPLDLVLLLLGAHAGLRASEMVALRWEHVRFHDGERLGSLTVKRGKGGKTAAVSMSPALADALLAWRALAPDLVHVLPFRTRQRVGQRLEALARRAGVEKTDRLAAVHSLRHYAGTRMYRATGDLYRVADHLRHSNINTSRRYAKATPEQRDAAVLAAFG